MTTKPTLGSNKAVGAVLGSADWNVNVIQQGNYIDELVAGTNADKIPASALSLVGTTSLETYNTTALPGTAGTAVEVARVRGNDTANTNTLRSILRRIVGGSGWVGTRWRLSADIDNGNNKAHIDLGSDGTASGSVTIGTNNVDRLLVDATGNVAILSGGLTTSGSIAAGGTLAARLNGAAGGTGAGGLLAAWNRSGGNAEVTFYNDRTSPTTAFEWVYWDGAAWVPVLTLAASGKLTGPAFYDSGEFSLTAGANLSLTTPWTGGGIGPRHVWGLAGSSSANENTPFSNNNLTSGGMRFTSMTESVINVNNSSGVTLYGRVFAWR